MLEMPPLRVVLIVNQEVSCSPRALELNKLTSFGVSNKNPDSNSHSPVISIELSKKKKKKRSHVKPIGFMKYLVTYNMKLLTWYALISDNVYYC